MRLRPLEQNGWRCERPTQSACAAQYGLGDRAQHVGVPYNDPGAACTGWTRSKTRGFTPPQGVSSTKLSPRSGQRCGRCLGSVPIGPKARAMVSVDGNFYSVPDATRRGVVEVHTPAEELRIFEDGALIATHPILEGRHQGAWPRRLDPQRRDRADARAAWRRKDPPLSVALGHVPSSWASRSSIIALTNP